VKTNLRLSVFSVLCAGILSICAGAAWAHDEHRHDPTVTDGKAATGHELIDLAIRARAADRKVVRVKQGETVVLRWTSDEDAELHLHGYDITAEIKRDHPVVMAFQAYATGRFPITAHGFGADHSDHGGEPTLIYLEVLPQ